MTKKKAKTRIDEASSRYKPIHRTPRVRKPSFIKKLITPLRSFNLLVTNDYYDVYHAFFAH